MDKKTKRRVRGVAVFVVFLALATSILIFSRKERKPISPDFKASMQKYQAYRMINKAHFQFTTDNLAEAKSRIEALVKEKGSKSLEIMDQPSYGAFLFVTNSDNLDEIQSNLGSIGRIVSRSATTDTSFVNLDYGVELARLKSYEREMNDLDNIRFPSEIQIRRKETLHRLIGESTTKLDKLQDVDNLLLFITVSPIVKRSSYVEMVREFAITFLMWFGIYFVGVILVYYGTKLLMLLLNMMGVKGLGISGGDYGSSYNYGGYKNYSSPYGYGHKRKTKRIYKEKPSSTEEEK